MNNIITSRHLVTHDLKIRIRQSKAFNLCFPDLLTLPSCTAILAFKPLTVLLAFPLGQYYGKRAVKDFRGNDSTKSAIETARKGAASGENRGKTSGSGRTRYLKLSERSLKVLKRDAREVVAKHPVSNVCCVVRDTVEPGFFGYITASEGSGAIVRHTHVFSTECVGKTSEILKVLTSLWHTYRRF